MSRLRFALIFVFALLAASASVYSTAAISARVTSAAPALQATASVPTPVPTLVPAVGPQSAAPVGEGTQEALLIVGMVVLSALLIGGGIYLRRRWIATRY